MRLPRDAALAAIGAYQRYVSPHKGFCCAYRVHTGRAGCSALGARAIRRWGLWQGLQVLRGRLRRCGEAHQRCVSGARHRTQAAQRGSCDVELPDVDCCDAADCCDCDDCFNRDRQKSRAAPADKRGRQSRRREQSGDSSASKRS